MRITLSLINFGSYCVLKTRDLPSPVSFDGLVSRGITIQSIYDFSMTGWLCLRDTLSRGISAYLASRVGCISASTLPKRLNVQTLITTLGIGISLFADLTKGCCTHITGSPYISISDT